MVTSGLTQGSLRVAHGYTRLNETRVMPLLQGAPRDTQKIWGWSLAHGFQKLSCEHSRAGTRLHA